MFCLAKVNYLTILAAFLLHIWCVPHYISSSPGSEFPCLCMSVASLLLGLSLYCIILVLYSLSSIMMCTPSGTTHVCYRHS